ncbi:protein kinase domain-containing protein [Ditylenchus destructor]|nr:protein kinase domain-containing protein [Ditylenchus destructor]
MNVIMRLINILFVLYIATVTSENDKITDTIQTPETVKAGEAVKETIEKQFLFKPIETENSPTKNHPTHLLKSKEQTKKPSDDVSSGFANRWQDSKIPLYQISDLSEIGLKHFEPQVELGKGEYGKVWKVQKIADSSNLAMKCAEAQEGEERVVREEFASEIRIMKSSTWPHIARIHGWFKLSGEKKVKGRERRGNQYCYLMDVYSGGSIESLLREKIDIRKAITIYSEVFSGMDYLHQHAIAHRDIKPGNVLLAREQGTVKMIDFGFSTTIDSKKEAHTGDYAPPEFQIRPNGKLSINSKAADYWSLGCVLLEMVSAPNEHNGSNDLKNYQHNIIHMIRDDLIRKNMGISEFHAKIAKMLVDEVLNKIEERRELKDDQEWLFVRKTAIHLMEPNMDKRLKNFAEVKKDMETFAKDNTWLKTKFYSRVHPAGKH